MRSDTMLYPGYVPSAGLLPAILHYGAHYEITRHARAVESAGGILPPRGSEGGAAIDKVAFNKMEHTNLDLYRCAEAGSYFFFDVPPPEAQLAGRSVLVADIPWVAQSVEAFRRPALRPLIAFNNL